METQTPCKRCGSLTFCRAGTLRSKRASPLRRCKACRLIQSGTCPAHPTRGTRRPVPEQAVCSHCNASAKHLKRTGTKRGRDRYQCLQCLRHSFGTPPQPAPIYTCPNPNCNGRCVKNGRDKNGDQRYLCRKCNRNTINFQPNPPRYEHQEYGPYRYHIGFNLGYFAYQALAAYCALHQIPPTEAARRILRQAADEPTRLMASGRRPQKRTPNPDENTRLLRFRLPNISRETTIARMREGGKHHKNVLVIRPLKVRLDAKAYVGLLRFMQRTGLNHQQAARTLFTQAHPNRRPILRATSKTVQ